MIIAQAAWNSRMAVYLIALVFLSWLCAMVGYAVAVGIAIGVHWAFLFIGVVCTVLLVAAIVAYSRGT